MGAERWGCLDQRHVHSPNRTGCDGDGMPHLIHILPSGLPATVDEVSLRWSGSLGFSELYRNEVLWYTKGIYAIMSPSPLELLYVGMTYDQRFSTEIANHLGPFDRGVPVVSRADRMGKWIYRNHTKDPRVKIAHVELVSGERISRSLVRDIEAVLILRYQPPANIQSTRSYSGRNIRIRHRGWRVPFDAEDDTDF